MFKDWQDFYLLVGSAAGALIGLLFVVATLNTRIERSRARAASTVYLTPIIFHLAMVFVMSGMAMVPDLSRPLVATLVSLAAFIGVVHGGVILMLFRALDFPEHPHWSDVWWYVVAPAVAYAGLSGAASLLWFGGKWATQALGAVLVVILLLCIRNAWDLVTWLAPIPDGEDEE